MQVCYFDKRVDDPVDASIYDDECITHTELDTDTIASVAQISATNIEAVTGPINNGPFKVDEDAIEDFQKDGKPFIDLLLQIDERTKTGLALQPVNDSGFPDFESLTPSNVLNVNQRPELVTLLQHTLNGWCDQLESYWKAHVFERSKVATGDEPKFDSGPEGEIEYWNYRAQRLSVASEQLREIHCSHVVSLVKAIITGSNQSERAMPDRGASLDRWNSWYGQIVGATTVAKESKKHLLTLKPYIAALYSGDVRAISTKLSSLMNTTEVRLKAPDYL
jgi:hypothetical protein